MFELINVFNIFLPQLLLYPNPKDPLNPEAAALLITSKKKFENFAKFYILKFSLNPNLQADNYYNEI